MINSNMLMSVAIVQSFKICLWIVLSGIVAFFGFPRQTHLLISKVLIF